MESYTVNLGRYFLFNIPIDLVLKIELWKNLKGSQVAKMIIPLPQNYPLTQTGTSDMVKLKGLFEAELSVISSSNRSWNLYQINTLQKQFGIAGKKAVSLNKFYNIAKSENLIITPEENLLFSGLGKRFICSGFPYILEYFNVNPDETLILLQASGGAVRTDNDRLRVQKYLQLGRNNIMQIYQNKYPEDFNETYIFFVKYSDLELAEALVSLENNERLIQYYTEAFGFQPLDYTSTETMMATTLSTFIYNCGSVEKLS